MSREKKITIVIGVDHRGYQMKEFLKKQLVIPQMTISWLDVGAYSEQRSDYPEFAIAACTALLEGKADVGILICGSGVGMAITANRFSKIYAALAWNDTVARLSREDDNSNVLVLPSDFVTNEQAISMVIAWLTADFKNGRYKQRIAMIDSIS